MDDEKTVEQKTDETLLVASRWEENPPIASNRPLLNVSDDDDDGVGDAVGDDGDGEDGDDTHFVSVILSSCDDVYCGDVIGHASSVSLVISVHRLGVCGGDDDGDDEDDDDDGSNNDAAPGGAIVNTDNRISHVLPSLHSRGSHRRRPPRTTTTATTTATIATTVTPTATYNSNNNNNNNNNNSRTPGFVRWDIPVPPRLRMCHP